jgi:hypothetical protein
MRTGCGAQCNQSFNRFVRSVVGKLITTRRSVPRPPSQRPLATPPPPTLSLSLSTSRRSVPRPSSHSQRPLATPPPPTLSLSLHLASLCPTPPSQRSLATPPPPTLSLSRRRRYAWPGGLGRLSARGMQQAFHVGAELHRRYQQRFHLWNATYKPDHMVIPPAACPLASWAWRWDAHSLFALETHPCGSQLSFGGCYQRECVKAIWARTACTCIQRCLLTLFRHPLIPFGRKGQTNSRGPTFFFQVMWAADYERTIDSMNAALLGLFPPAGGRQSSVHSDCLCRARPAVRPSLPP